MPFFLREPEVRKIIVSTLLIGAVVFGVLCLRQGTDNSHSGFPGTTDNRSSSQKSASFAGTNSCRACHTEIADLYSSSGHAHTFHATTDSELAKQLDGISFDDPLRKGQFRYHFDSEGLAASLPEKFGNELFPLSYALGSGAHGVTFLTLLPHRDGSTIGLEHRATWYKQKSGLDLTVGHAYLGAPVEDAEHFGRVLSSRKLTQCIECHTTSGRVENGLIKGLIPHVGCESCHGAASHHVEVRSSGAEDIDFAAAKTWPDAMSELRTCGRCHRLPESIKKSELVRESKVLPRFQPAGLMQSPCFQKSEGAMRCTTCHDPHAKTSKDATRYEQICMDCHQTQSVASCPKSSNNCIQCHMPPISLEGVASFHDHWIRIRNEQDPSVLQPEIDSEN